jgi:hypothetical protein
VLAASLVRFTLEQRQRQPPREEPSVASTCQTRCMRQQRAVELLLTKVHQSLIILGPTLAQPNQKYATYLEIRVRHGPAARADSGTDAIVDNFHELCFHGAEQSTP